MRTVAGRRTGDRVEAGKGTADAGIIFQAVETGIDRNRCATEVVAELYALVGQRAYVAPRSFLAEA